MSGQIFKNKILFENLNKKETWLYCDHITKAVISVLSMILERKSELKRFKQNGFLDP